MRTPLAACLLASLAFSPLAFAADAPPAPPATTTPAPTAPAAQPLAQPPVAAPALLEARITGVEGLVQVRDADGQPWKKAEVGMVVKQDAEFRTGPKSAVRFEIPPDQTITLDRLGTVKLLKAIEQNGKIITNLGMKYGRTRYDIEAAGKEHESTISSPSSTLAVRGTKVSLYEQRPFNVEAVSLTGTASFRDGKKQLLFGAKNAGKVKVNETSSTAAAVALGQASVDPSASMARTNAEAALVGTLLSSGATVSFDRDAGIKVVTGGFPPTDQQLIPALPGYLNFVLRWHTDSDLNLTIGSPGGKDKAGELIYPVAGLSTSKSGGATAFDHRGGSNGGVEVVYWPANRFPEGNYGVGVGLVSGPATLATVDVFLDGRRIPIFNGQGFSPSVTTPVLPPIPGIGEGTAIGVVQISSKR